MLRIQPIPNRDRQSQRESLLSLHIEQLWLGPSFRTISSVFRAARGKHLVADVIERDIFDQWLDNMHSGIQRPRLRSAGLAHANASHPARHDHNAARQQDRSPRQQTQRQRRPPPPLRLRRNRRHTRRCYCPAIQQLPIQVVTQNAYSHENHPEATAHQQVLQRQHGRSPLRVLWRELSASALVSPWRFAWPASEVRRTGGTLARRSTLPPAGPPPARKPFPPPLP